MNVGMTVALGPDWQDSFDIICADCRKPLWQRADNPFFQYDESKKDRKGSRLQTLD
jgi:hypothetical protein